MKRLTKELYMLHKIAAKHDLDVSIIFFINIVPYSLL